MVGSPFAYLFFGRLGGYEGRVNANWERAARRLGGSLSRPKGWFGPPPMTLVAHENGLEVVAIAVSNLPGGGVLANTEASAPAVIPDGFTLSATPKGRESPTFWLGVDVATSEPELAAAWLTEPLTQAIAEARPYGFHLGRSRVVAIRVGIEEDGRRLARAVRATAALAARGGEMAAAWERLAAELDGIVRAPLWGAGDAHIVIDARGFETNLEVCAQALHGHGTPVRVTHLRARRGTVSNEVFSFTGGGALAIEGSAHVELSGMEGGLNVVSTEMTTTRGRLEDRELVDAWVTANPTYARGTEDELFVVFRGVVLDATRLSAAVRIMGRMRRVESVDPYR